MALRILCKIVLAYLRPSIFRDKFDPNGYVCPLLLDRRSRTISRGPYSIHDSACCKRSLKSAREHTDAMKDSQYNNSHGTYIGQQKIGAIAIQTAIFDRSFRFRITSERISGASRGTGWIWQPSSTVMFLS